MALGAAFLVAACALVAAWIFADEPTRADGALTATVALDGNAVIVSGELPSTRARDELFEVLAEEGAITVIVSEVRIMPDTEPSASIGDLAHSLLADLRPDVAADG